MFSIIFTVVFTFTTIAVLLAVGGTAIYFANIMLFIMAAVTLIGILVILYALFKGFRSGNPTKQKISFVFTVGILVIALYLLLCILAK